MRRSVLGASSLALGLALAAAPLNAQFFAGAYATLPSGDYGEYAKTGWMAEAGYGFWRSANDRLAVWGAVGYGSNSHEGDADDKTNLLSGQAEVTYSLMAGGDGAYLIGTLGYLRHTYSPGNDAFDSVSEGGISFGGGAGWSFGKFWVEGRYTTASIENSTTAFIMLGAGISL
jgi:hypothetical protein